MLSFLSPSKAPGPSESEVAGAGATALPALDENASRRGSQGKAAALVPRGTDVNVQQELLQQLADTKVRYEGGSARLGHVLPRRGERAPADEKWGALFQRDTSYTLRASATLTAL
jgi:hypothetical protein